MIDPVAEARGFEVTRPTDPRYFPEEYVELFDRTESAMDRLLEMPAAIKKHSVPWTLNNPSCGVQSFSHCDGRLRTGKRHVGRDLI